MKRSIFFISLVFACLCLTAQTYHPLISTGKVWSTYHNYCKAKSNPFSDYTKFEGEIQGGSLTYTRVLVSHDTDSSAWDCNSYIREDEYKRVYLLSFPSDQLLYDFNLQQGDSVFLREQIEYPYVVDSTGMTILTDNEQRKVIYLHSRIFPSYKETWIEGIGSDRGVMHSGELNYVGDAPRLMCFFEYDTLKYHNPDYQDCSVLSGIKENNSGNPIILYPNPSSGNFTLQLDQEVAKNAVLDIFDAAGKQLLSIPLKTNPITVHSSQYGIVSGTYLYRIHSPGKADIRGKITIQK
jgi:hypothetical protein